LQATAEAFGFKRRTLFLWKRKLKEAEGKFEGLNKKKTTPKIKRKRIWPLEILAEIKRLRWKHPNSFAFMFVLTDNGSEFKKHFSEELRKLHLTHYHTYPKTPKMNAHLERFNCTLQEEFVDYHLADLLIPEIFNRKLAEYLLWYNAKRVHFAFQNKLSPIQFMSSLPINQLPEKRKSGWPHTTLLFFIQM